MLFIAKKPAGVRFGAPVVVLGGAALAVGAIHCSSASGVNGAPGAASLVDVTPVAPGAQCPAGGYEVQAGVDGNGNGVLDPSEVQSTEYVCNGAGGQGGVAGPGSTVEVTPVPPGSQCPAGGYKVQVNGPDGGVESTSYVCNGAAPSVDAGGPVPVSVAAGALHACALFSDGSVWCWGNSSQGQTGPNAGAVFCPGFVGACDLTPVPVPLPHAATAIAAGMTGSSCAILSDGSLWCWGDNTYGELGTTSIPSGGGNQHSANPVQVELPTGKSATAVTIGYDHACAVLQDGSVWCWGSDSVGQLGPTQTASSPTPVQSFSGSAFPYVAIAAGYEFTCALSTPLQHGGNMTCWGSDTDIQFAAALYGQNSVALSAGGQHVCVVQPPTGDSTGQATPAGASGTVMCTGDNSEGALGIGNTTPETQNDLFTPVVLLANASLLAAGAETSCAVVPGGSVACWGENSQGALGDGTTNNSSIPVWVEGLSGVTSLAAGGLPLEFPPGGAALDYSCAVSNGQVWCWGDNSSGELGDGTTVSSSTPVLVSFAPSVSAGADASADAPADVAVDAPDGGGGKGFEDGWQCASEADCTGDGGSQGWACCLENGIGTCVPAAAYPALTCSSTLTTLCSGPGDTNYCYGTTGGAGSAGCEGADASAPTVDGGVALYTCF
jgi:alpha-tubulin suppressor-like RCC1 family protein